MGNNTMKQVNNGIISILKKILFFTLLFCSALSVKAQQSSITASVDRTTVPVGYTISLKITPVDVNQDLSYDNLEALKKDFEIAGTSHTQEIRVFNGNYENSSSLTLALLPKKEGTLTIPALNINGKTTNPISITVTPAGNTQKNVVSRRRPGSFSSFFANDPFNDVFQQQIDDTLDMLDQMTGGSFIQPQQPFIQNQPSQQQVNQNQNSAQTQAQKAYHPSGSSAGNQSNNSTASAVNTHNNAPIFVESFVDKTNPYKGEQVVYTTKVYSQNPLGQSSIDPPEKISGKFDSEKARNLRNGREFLNNTEYYTYETDNVIFPSITGEIEIPPASINVVSRRRGIGVARFFSPQPQKYIGNPVKITVKNETDGGKNSTWLPAKEITISDNVVPKQATYKIGDSITRTITITAKGQLSKNLPEITAPTDNKFNLYKTLDKRDDNYSEISNYGVLGTYTVEFVVVPVDSGEISLPEYKLTYFNTEKNQFETASTPSVKLIIEKSAGRNDKIAADINKTTPEDDIAEEKQEENIFTLKDAFNQCIKYTQTYKKDIFIIAVFVLLIWIFSFIRKKKQEKLNDASNADIILENDLKRDLKNAISAQDPAAAKFTAIKIYNKEFGTNYTSLEAVASDLKYIQFSAEVDIMNTALYSVSKKTWGRKEFYDTLMMGIKNKKEIINQSPTVPKLYPF